MINLVSGVEGRYRIEKSKADENGVEIPGTRVVCADWFQNLVLDQALNEIGTRALSLSNIAIAFRVGSGNTAPLVTDTQLQSQIASTVTAQGAPTSGVVPSPGAYIWRRQTRRFAAGVAAGILAEVGVGWAQTGGTLFSRALIVDDMGAPTTITVLADEILDVSYEFRVYPQETDSTGTLVLDGITYDYTARASRINVVNVWFSQTPGNQFLGSASAFTGNIGPLTGTPSGTGSPTATGASIPYANNSLEGSATATWGLNTGNIGGIRSVQIGVGWSNWQIQFDAQGTGNTIPKDATNELSLTVTHSWARRTI